MSKFREVILFCSLTFFLSLNVNSQPVENYDKQIHSYFVERITNYAKEDSLVAFEHQLDVKESEIADFAKRTWEVWKNTNNEIEKIPELLGSDLAELDLNKWELIDEDPMPFYFIKKGAQLIDKKLPLFLNLHGSGPKDSELKATLHWSKIYDDSPSIYFIPQIPNEQRYRWWFKPEQLAWERLFRLAMVNKEIDANRIYIMGISEGGYGSQRLGAFYADYIAGAGPMAGGEPLENAPPENFQNIAFSLETGQMDGGFGRNELTGLAGTTFDSLAVGNPGSFINKINLQEGKGHVIDYTVTTPWLSKFIRNPRPKNFSWVYFPMDDRYRKGFYNIAIRKSLTLNPEDEINRARFDVDFNKNENTIYLNGFLSDDELEAKEAIKKGSVDIFFNQDYLDLEEKVKVILNEEEVYNDYVKLKGENIIESIAFYGDPDRVFPAKITLDF